MGVKRSEKGFLFDFRHDRTPCFVMVFYIQIPLSMLRSGAVVGALGIPLAMTLLVTIKLKIKTPDSQNQEQ